MCLNPKSACIQLSDMSPYRQDWWWGSTFAGDLFGVHVENSVPSSECLLGLSWE